MPPGDERLVISVADVFVVLLSYTDIHQTEPAYTGYTAKIGGDRGLPYDFGVDI